MRQLGTAARLKHSHKAYLREAGFYLGLALHLHLSGVERTFRGLQFLQRAGGDASIAETPVSIAPVPSVRM